MRRTDSNFRGRTACVRNISLRRSIFITATLYISSVSPSRYSVTANWQIHSIVLPTRGIPARGENFSNKFRHAISSLPKSWEWRFKGWSRVAPTCVLISTDQFRHHHHHYPLKLRNYYALRFRMQVSLASLYPEPTLQNDY